MFTPAPPLNTNTEVGPFTPTLNAYCHVYHVTKEFPSNVTLQIYPFNARKECFYTLPPFYHLLVYCKSKNNTWICNAEVSTNDSYIYFKAPLDTAAIYCIVAKNKAEADEYTALL
jgi:hypothetical protein